MAKQNFGEQDNEFGIQKPYTQYANDYEIIVSVDDFKQRFNRKFKIATLTQENTIILESYIHIGQDNRNPNNYLCYKLENGKPIQTEINNVVRAKKFSYTYSDLFENNVLCFVGYISPLSKIKEIIRDRNENQPK